jgi:hypothetical protein
VASRFNVNRTVYLLCYSLSQLVVHSSVPRFKPLPVPAANQAIYQSTEPDSFPIVVKQPESAPFACCRAT